ncbi:MAG: RNA ligase [Halobacteria archaeon]|nr:RNA ligase [Halobacteria archaeon]
MDKKGDYHEKLGLSRSEFEDSLEKFSQKSYDGQEHEWDYRHLPDYHHDLYKGTVLIDGNVVQGFPKIPRTLILEEGIPRHFDGEVVVEEKMDGYNTRVVRIDGEVLAFSRSGIICPFTTHKVKKILPLEPFFDDNPDAMLCGEMVGSENPYTTHGYPGVDSLEFRAFDIRGRESGKSLAVEERRAVCEEYGIPQVELYGIFDVEDTPDEVKRVVKKLDEEGREGIVMKSHDVSQQLKYTTSAANQGDLEFAFSLPFDYGRDFMFRRLIREAFQAVEWQENEEELEERAHGLGESILKPMVETIHEIDEGEYVGERHTVRAEPDVVERLFDHFGEMGLHIDIEEDRQENGERVVKFVKRSQATNDKTRVYLDGQIVRE